MTHAINAPTQTPNPFQPHDGNGSISLCREHASGRRQTNWWLTSCTVRRVLNSEDLSRCKEASIVNGDSGGSSEFECISEVNDEDKQSSIAMSMSNPHPPPFSTLTYIEQRLTKIFNHHS